MNTKPISPLAHGLIDYALVSSLLLVPAALGFPRQVRRIYAAEAVGLLGYVAVSDHPTAVKPLIPYRTHGRIDPVNVAGFALQSFARPFRKSRRALIFNIAFTVLSAASVILTDWKRG